jgi:RNA polymerase sigma-70 factor (ECF subfamily)
MDAPTPSFADLLARLDAHDPAAARALHARYTPRLVALARQRLGGLRHKADPESAVQSALGSFFRRYDGGEFRLGDWDDLWGLLAVITARKAANRVRFLRQECRDVGREVPLAGGEPESGDGQLADPEPTPADAVALAELLGFALDGLSEQDRRVVEMLLAGHTIDETRAAVGCGERTVRRVRDRVRAKLRRIDDSLGKTS